MPDYRALAQALDPYAMDTGGLTPDAIKMFQSGYKLPNFLGMTASQPTPQEIERMVAEQSPAFGVFPQMKPYRSQQDITASANVPVDLLRGRVASTRGLFGDVVNQPIPMVRPLQLLSQAFTGQQKYPDTEHYLDTMPLKSNTPIGDVAGRIGSFAPINPMPAVRAGQKGLNLLGMEVADRLATGRSVLPSLLKEPQTAMFAVNPADQMAQAVTKAEVSPLGFYSAVEQQALKIPRKQGTGDSFLNDLMKGQDVKKYEIEAMGLENYLRGKPNVTRQEVQDFIANNKLNVQERQLGETITEDPIGIAKRKAVFDKYEPQIQALDQEMQQYETNIINARNLASKNLMEANAALNKENLFGSQPIPTTEDWNRYYLAKAESERVNKIPLNLNEFRKRSDSLHDARDAEANAAYVVPESTPTKYEKYQLPGGENYREILLKLPPTENVVEQWMVYRPNGASIGGFSSEEYAKRAAKEIGGTYKQGESLRGEAGYRSSHWSDPNVLAHMRVNDRVDAEGKKMLLIEEVQSDWHQAGREKGYASLVDKKALENELNNVAKERNDLVAELSKYEQQNGFLSLEMQQRWDKFKEKEDLLKQRNKDFSSQPPDAPFKDTWHQLALKRAIKEAVDKGYDRIGLTTGAQQAERYDLSKQISKVMWDKETGRLTAYDKNATERRSNGRTVIDESGVTEQKLADYIGKEAAQKLIKETPDEEGTRFLSGLDLQVGGEGMKKYYDEVYPNYLNKLGKKYGAQVGETKVNTGKPAYVDYIVGPGNFNDTTVLGVRSDGSTTILNQNANSMEEAQQLVNRYKKEKNLGGGGEPVRYLDITPEMRKAIKEGQPLASIEEELAKALA